MTVVVPTLDRGAVLGRALESLLPEKQGVDPSWFEIVVVDGQSQDDTDEVIESYADRLPIRTFVLPPRGVYAALNDGLEAARGSHFTWLNSDDELAPRSLAAVASALTSSRGCDVLTGAARLRRYPDGRVVARFGPSSASALTPAAVCFGTPIPNARIYSTELLDRVGGFDPGYRVASDRDWLLRISRSGATEARLDGYVYDYWQHPDSLTFAGGKAPAAHRQEYVRVASTHLEGCRTPADRLVLGAWRAWHRRMADREAGLLGGAGARDLPALVLAALLKARFRLASAGGTGSLTLEE